MKKIKYIFLIVLVIPILIGLAGCNSNNSVENKELNKQLSEIENYNEEQLVIAINKNLNSYHSLTYEQYHNYYFQAIENIKTEEYKTKASRFLVEYILMLKKKTDIYKTMINQNSSPFLSILDTKNIQDENYIIKALNKQISENKMLVKKNDDILTIHLDYVFFISEYKNNLINKDLNFLNLLSDGTKNTGNISFISKHIENIIYFSDNNPSYPYSQYLNIEIENSLYELVYFLTERNKTEIKNEKILDFAEDIIKLKDQEKHEEIEIKLKEFFYKELNIN